MNSNGNNCTNNLSMYDNKNIKKIFSESECFCYICVCCSQKSYCKRTQKIVESSSTFKSESSFKTTTTSQRLNCAHLNRLLIFSDPAKFIKKYSTFNKKLKFNLLLTHVLTSIFFIYLVFFLTTNLYSLRDVRFNDKLPYDLMKDALLKQNITKYRITCEQMRSANETDRAGNENQLNTKYSLIKDYFNLNMTKKNVLNFDLDYQSYFSREASFIQPQSNTNIIGKFFSQLKLCTIGSYEKIFASNQVKNDSELFKTLNKKYLTRDDLETILNSDLKLAYGGLYTSPLCIQDFLHHFSNQHGLELIRNTVVENMRSSGNIQQMLDKITEQTYPIVKNILKANVSLVNDYINLKNSYTLVVIPYLNRHENLIELIANLHPFLQRQFLNYVIIVAEQFNSRDPFNKGRLYNAAFEYLSENFNFYSSFLDDRSKIKINCIILHDVDLVPESDYNSYGCDYFDNSPRHLSLSIRRHKSQLKLSSYEKNLYEMLVGGVLCMKPQIFRLINGFSNEYWLWGGEDDDIGMRMIAKNVCIKRPNYENALYRMIEHVKSEKNPVRENLLFSSVHRMKIDGISNIKRLNVSVVGVERYNLFTLIKIDVGKRSSNYFQKYNFTISRTS